MDLNLKDQKVIVTAGAQGIGLAITAAFVEAGAHVHICDISEDFLASARERFGTAPVSYSRTDVSRASEVDAMFAELAQRWDGRLDVLVNNAGIAGPTLPVEEVDLSGWDQTIAVNLTGPFLCTRRAVPMLKNMGAAPSSTSPRSLAGWALRCARPTRPSSMASSG